MLDAAWLGTTINEVREVIAAAVQQGRSDPRALFVAALHRGRIPALFRTGLEEILNGARSVPEAEVVRRMARANITGLRFNARVYDGSRFLCLPDVLDEDSWTALEIDSMEYHLSPEAYRRTQERRRRAIAAGLIVVSATPSEIYRDFDGVLENFGSDRAGTVPHPALKPPRCLAPGDCSPSHLRRWQRFPSPGASRLRRGGATPPRGVPSRRPLRGACRPARSPPGSRPRPPPSARGACARGRRAD